MKTSALYSRYIIDGVQQELTPAGMLDSVLEPGSHEPRRQDDEGPWCAIADESVDPGVKPISLDPGCVDDYLEKCLSAEAGFPAAFAGSIARGRVAGALIDSIWRQGRFKLDDLVLTAKWTWRQENVGDMAAFYSSVEAAADYIDGLGVSLRRYSYAEGTPSLRLSTPFSGAARVCPQGVVDDPSSWIVYIPFDTSDYRLGGSLLAQTLGLSGGVAPQVTDADYFIDCYEVVREMVEDGVVISGVTVGQGGLLTAVRQMCGSSIGADIDLSDTLRALGERDLVRVLFAEVPGVIIQIRDMDFDYLDAELLLQDVLFFPLGHPVPGRGDVHVHASAKTGLQTILESLIHNQCGEGED